MTPTTPTKSPVDTIREALKEAQRIMLRDYPEEANDPSEYHESLVHAISALSSLFTQPAQTEGLDVVNGDPYGTEAMFAATDEARKRYPIGCSPDAMIGITIDQIARLAFVSGAQWQAQRNLPRHKGEVDMETVIDIRAAIIELMGTGVKVPTTEDLIAYMATSPSNSNP